MSLRNQLIKLAFENPELRKDVLPLVMQFKDPASENENKPEHWYNLPPRGVQASGTRKFIDPKHLAQAAAMHKDAAKLTAELVDFAREAKAQVDVLEDLREKLKREYVDAAIRAGSTEDPEFLGDDWSETPEAKDIAVALDYYDEFYKGNSNPVVRAAAQLETDLKYLADPSDWNARWR